MEAIREGVEDFEYLRMLRDRVRELESRGVTGEALAGSRVLLAGAADRVLAGQQSASLQWKTPPRIGPRPTAYALKFSSVRASIRTDFASTGKSGVLEADVSSDEPARGKSTPHFPAPLPCPPTKPVSCRVVSSSFR